MKAIIEESNKGSFLFFDLFMSLVIGTLVTLTAIAAYGDALSIGMAVGIFFIIAFMVSTCFFIRLLSKETPHETLLRIESDLAKSNGRLLLVVSMVLLFAVVAPMVVMHDLEIINTDIVTIAIGFSCMLISVIAVYNTVIEQRGIKALL